MATTTWTQDAGMTSPTEADNVENFSEAAEASKDAAAASATAAAGSATSASGSETTASTKAAESAVNATASLTSASASQAARVASEAAKTAAETAETNASNSATTATTQAATATTKAGDATSSAVSATQSASVASSHATSATSSASTATTQAGNAATSATASEASKVTAVAAQTAAETAETNAETAQTAAETAQTAAETAETNAATSATTATTQATTATTKAGEAAASATAAAASETAASGSETSAASSATTATTQATNASTSATQAAGSAIAAGAAQTAAETAETNAETAQAAAETAETNAAASETAASTSETNASTSAATATTKAGEASSSAVAATQAASVASGHATSATSSAATATTQATNASTSATASETSKVASVAAQAAAETAETNAETAQTAAETAETNAAASETAAATSATSASGSASTATTQAGISTTKAGEASTSATSAATSATSASASKDAALAALDSFDDRYLGQKSADPTVDNDGDALVAGALYFNTSTDSMMVYEGSTWVAAYASLSGALLAASNLSDVSDAATARTNLGLAIGTNVQAYSAVLAATTASYTTAEETKLAGIEANATADQTAAEIKTAYESNSDTNEFSDAEQTKLAGIEASADVTDTANVVNALTAGTNVTIAANGTISSTDTNTIYTHPTHNGDDFSVDTGALTGATVVSDIDINVTTDGLGHVTDANGSVATRTLTLSDLGYTGATNATANVGDITGVTAGNGLTGGGTSGTVTLNHSDTSSQSSVNNSGRTYIQDITLDTYGHITSISSATETVVNTDTNTVPHNATITLTAGNALSGGGNFTTDQSLNETITINHSDTSSQASVNNSGRTYIQDITLDTYGHITGINSATETVTNTNTNQLTTFVVEDGDGTEVTISHGKEWKFREAGGVNINWTDTSTGSDGDPFDLSFNVSTSITAGGGLTGGGALSSSRTISHADTSSQSSVNNSGRTYIQDITLDTYGHITGITSATETVVNTDTNTTYSAGTNLSLSGTTFNVSSNPSFTDVYVADQILHTGDTNTYLQFHAVDQWRVVTGGSERLEVNNSQITSTEPIHAPSFHGDGSSLTGVGGSTTYGAVGTYVFGRRVGSASDQAQFVAGSTYAGSTLYPAGISGNVAQVALYWQTSISTLFTGSTSSSALSGTWRAMGTTNSGEVENPVTLFVRIS